eukprot:6934643-Pyramimonas_sp.AAC.1
MRRELRGPTAWHAARRGGRSRQAVHGQRARPNVRSIGPFVASLGCKSRSAANIVWSVPRSGTCRTRWSTGA